MALIEVPADKATEALMRAAGEAAASTAGILEQLPLSEGVLDIDTAHEIADGLANALATVLSMGRDTLEDDNQLFGALTRWLP